MGARRGRRALSVFAMLVVAGRVAMACEDESTSGNPTVDAGGFDAPVADRNVGPQPEGGGSDGGGTDAADTGVDAGPCGFTSARDAAAPVVTFHLDEGSGTTSTSTTHDAGATTTITWKDVTWVSGPSGCNSAVAFNGTSSIGVAPDEPDLNFTEGVTASAWVKIDEAPAASYGIVSKYDGTDGWILGINASAKPFFTVRHLGNSVTIIWQTSTIADGKWHHMAGSYKVDGARFTLDGVMTGPGSPGAFLPYITNTGKLVVGNSTGMPDGGTSPTEFLKGAVDEIRIYPFETSPAP